MVRFAILDRRLRLQRGAAVGRICGGAPPAPGEECDGEAVTMSAWVRQYFDSGDWKHNAAAFRRDAGAGGSWVNIYRDPELRPYVTGFSTVQRVSDAGTQTHRSIQAAGLLELTEADLDTARRASTLTAGVHKGGYGDIAVCAGGREDVQAP